MIISHMRSINDIRGACTNAYQNYDKCSNISHIGARLLLYALITAQRVSTLVYIINIQGCSPHMRQ